jgi:hypothetical protein
MASLTFIIQALLARHEAYVSDAERDRKRILSKMEELEQDKRHLEDKNRETLEENRKLLDQLEAFNLAVTSSDAQVQSLTDKLHATEQSLERMNGLATQSESLQRQLSRLEEEEARLHTNLDTTKENERAAVLRWQQAERTIVNLHLQIEQLEHEAKKERDRVDEEILARQKNVLAAEMQQSDQFDRVSSAKTLPQAKSANNVISHFVKDILADNANLQLSIVELRGLLQRSNEQVEQLQDQLVQHPPLEDPSPRSPTPTLGVELGAGTKEFHVHHHYHAAIQAAESSKTPKSQIRRRTRNTRVRHSSGQFTPVSITSSPRSSISMFRPSSPASAGTIISPAITVPKQKARWSMQSNQTGFTSSSSLPSSPSGGSIFDRTFNDAATTTDISRPTSPESAGGFSPRGTGASHFDLMDRKRRQFSQRVNHIDLANPSAKEDGGDQYPGTPTSKAKPSSLSSKRNSALSHQDIASPFHSTIPEETEGTSLPKKAILTPDTDHSDFPISPSEDSSTPQLKRIASHESIFSVSGMDIHTLANQPIQRLISNRVISAPTLSSSTLTSTALSDASATAVRPSLYRKRVAANNDSFSRAYLSGVAASHIPSQVTVKKKPSMSQMMLGWWTRVATAEEDTGPLTQASLAAVDARSLSSGTAAKSVDSVESGLRTMAATQKPRPPGVNQLGPILGFGPEPATPFKACLGIGEVDEEALMDSLRENE